MTVGTVVKITSTFSEAPDSAAVTVVDPAGTTKVDAAAMTSESATVYSYVWQSAVTDPEGMYTAIVKATSGAYYPLSEGRFELNASLAP